MSEPQAKKKGGCRAGCFSLLIICGAMFLGIIALLIAGFVLAFQGGMKGNVLGWRDAKNYEWGVDARPPLEEIWSSGTGTTKVARIVLRGLIMLDEFSFVSDEGSAMAVLRAIKVATADPEVRAIILDVDSGGGGITASDIIFKALQNFKEGDPKRVVVALFGDIAASGAYYISLPADRIVAHPTTITGSIGVIMQSYNIRELAAKLGIADVTIKSGDNKDMLNPFRDLLPEQRQMLQGVIDAMYDRFVGLVAQCRKIRLEEARALADGRILLADQALEAHLIDQIGYAADAEKLTAELLGADDLRVIRYKEPSSFFDFFRNPSRFGFSLSSLLSQERTRLLYQSPF